MASLSRPPSLRFDERLPIVVVQDDDADDLETLRAGDSDTETEPDRRHKLPVEPPGPRLPAPPQHPIPSMQNAFAESLVEAMGIGLPKPKLRTGDVKARREELLDQDKEDPPPGALWRFRPGQECHELRRLMAQISFGVYLLLNGMANSQISVFSILQGHIDEVDEFLETTLEDIGLATKDLEDRTAHLKLPMDNVDVFERMLEDRNFRLQILEGNLKIEHIVTRTQVALEQTARDLGEAVDSTREFAAYLAEQENGRWRKDRPDVIDIFSAMKGNTDGWSIAFVDLQSKAGYLETVITQLGAMILEIERRAERVSRRARLSIQQPHVSPKQMSRMSRMSDASSIATPPASPPSIPSSPPAPRLPNTPPRISLRLSSISTAQSDSYFSFAMPLDEEPILIARPQSNQQEPRLEKLTLEEEPAPVIAPPARNPRRVSTQPIPRLETTVETTEEKEEDQGDMYILQPRTYTPQPPSPLPSPRVVDQPPRLEAPRLNPESRTLKVDSPTRFSQVSVQKLEPPMPRTLRVDSPTRFSQASMQSMQSMQSMEPEKPRVIPQQLRAQVSKPKLVAIAPKNNNKSSPKRAPPPVPLPFRELANSPALSQQEFANGRRQEPAQSPPQRPQEFTNGRRKESSQSPAQRQQDFGNHRRTESPAQIQQEFGNHRRTESPAQIHQEFGNNRRLESPAQTQQEFKFRRQQDHSQSPSQHPQEFRNSRRQEPSQTPPQRPQEFSFGHQQDQRQRDHQDSDAQPRQRTSLRQRVSLKTTPPESIQVPPREPRQQPIHLSPRTFQAPDSAYGSDVERPPANSISSIDPSLLDFPIPSVSRPTLIPSPHSDQQFFRPVQASPYSPLQQRPHTSGTTSNSYAPPRNIPSAMGMSMLSNVTTMTTDSTGTGRSVKKKRSAFGWLKKAFSLDEEERAAFEQKRREQSKNLYYDSRSPQFLDGKRIQPRQQGY